MFTEKIDCGKKKKKKLLRELYFFFLHIFPFSPKINIENQKKQLKINLRVAHTTTSITAVVDTTIYNGWYLYPRHDHRRDHRHVCHHDHMCFSCLAVETSLAPFAPLGPLLEPLELARLHRSRSASCTRY